MKYLIIPAARDEYSPSRVSQPITVRELIDELRNYDPEARVLLSHDGGYTYGTLRPIEFEEVDEDEM